MRVAGIDGCKAGWIAVIREPDGRIRSLIAETPTVIAMLDPTPIAAAIDIPIGLPEAGSRQCDRAARSILGGRRSSVFPAPIRPVLRARDWDEACSIRFALEGKRMSRQAWEIVSKVREVDSLLRANADLCRWLREFHPEVSFREWKGEPMPHSKKSPSGHADRLELVTRHFGHEVYGRIRAESSRSAVANDDILDAFAGLWTAERIATGAARRLSGEPPVDAHGLPMEMLY